MIIQVTLSINPWNITPGASQLPHRLLQRVVRKANKHPASWTSCLEAVGSSPGAVHVPPCVADGAWRSLCRLWPPSYICSSSSMFTCAFADSSMGWMGETMGMTLGGAGLLCRSVAMSHGHDRCYFLSTVIVSSTCYHLQNSLSLMIGHFHLSLQRCISLARIMSLYLPMQFITADFVSVIEYPLSHYLILGMTAPGYGRRDSTAEMNRTSFPRIR